MDNKQIVSGLRHSTLLLSAILACLAISVQYNLDSAVLLKERTQTEEKPGVWQSLERTEAIWPKKTAVIVCDMWDNHWCSGAAKRVGKLAVRIAPVLDAARRNGALIIHAPSETLDFYKDATQRKAAQAAPPISPPTATPVAEPALPIDFADGGCDTSPPDKFYKAWTRETSLIPIAKSDLISTDGVEVYRNLKSRGINTVMYVGVHTNICILKRPFAIRQMRAWGMRCLLIRDLTDAMYNPHAAPYVSHEAGTELVIEHIERYLAPSVLSADLLLAIRH